MARGRPLWGLGAARRGAWGGRGQPPVKGQGVVFEAFLCFFASTESEPRSPLTPRGSALLRPCFAARGNPGAHPPFLDYYRCYCYLHF